MKIKDFRMEIRKKKKKKKTGKFESEKIELCKTSGVK